MQFLGRTDPSWGSRLPHAAAEPAGHAWAGVAAVTPDGPRRRCSAQPPGGAARRSERPATAAALHNPAQEAAPANGRRRGGA